MLDQEELTDAEITESIYTGVDCCRDALYPKKAIRVTPTTAVIKPGQSVTLQGEHITRECDPACFHWRIIKGGGSLGEEFGHATRFFAPFRVEECEGSAIVGLFCGGKLADTCRIGVNEYTKDAYAYFKVENWQDGKLFDLTNNTVTSIVPPPRYKDINPKRSCIRITGRRCNGSIRILHYPGLIQGSLATNDHYILRQRWFGGGIYKNELHSAYGELGDSFEAAKTRLLREAFGRWVRLEVPTQKPWSDEWKAFHESFRAWSFTPGTTLDVRTPPMREAKCCPPELI